MVLSLISASLVILASLAGVDARGGWSFVRQSSNGTIGPLYMPSRNTTSGSSIGEELHIELESLECIPTTLPTTISWESWEVLEVLMVQVTLKTLHQGPLSTAQIWTIIPMRKGFLILNLLLMNLEAQLMTTLTAIQMETTHL
ncbi:hypothetical protein BASA83_006770 [Batrachochytrium salamandrivorans]|nr:hypothetical protein BASA83_006770 [Batrachochytrium salamandrivorans]